MLPKGVVRGQPEVYSKDSPGARRGCSPTTPGPWTSSALTKEDWSDWQGKHAADLVDRWGGPGVRRAIFDPLTRLKFDLPCREVSAAWLGDSISNYAVFEAVYNWRQ